MKDVLKRIIKEFHLNWVPKFIPRELTVPFDTNKIITIIGPRRAGKSYFLFQLIDKIHSSGITKENFIYINFEDERLTFQNNLDTIFEAYQELYPQITLSNCYFFFDEIQNFSNWEKFIRRTYDSISKNIFLTGSNAKLLSKEIATSLRGRSLTFHILPLSFKEYLKFKELNGEDIYSIKNRSILENELDKFLLWGSFPEVINFDEHLKLLTLQEYFNSVVYRDIAERYNISALHILKYVLKRITASYTKEFSVNKIFNDLKSRGYAISKDNIYQIVGHIFDSYYSIIIEKFNPSVLKREISNKKSYLIDNGFATAILYELTENRGKLLENAVVCECYKRYINQGYSIFYFKNNGECDILLYYRQNIVASFQVTDVLNRNNFERELNGLSLVYGRFKSEKNYIIARSFENNIENSLPEYVMPVKALEFFLGKF